MDRCGDRHGEAWGDDRPDRQGLAKSAGFRLRERDGSFRAAIWARPGPGVARATDHQPPQLAGSPGRAQGGNGLRTRDLLPGVRRPFGGPHRGGNRGDRDGARGDHPLPRRRARHRERLLSTQVEKPPDADIDRPTRLRLYQLMVELRDFEQRAYSRSVRKQSPQATPWPCDPMTTPSAPIAATATRSPAVRPWQLPWRNCSDAATACSMARVDRCT